MPKTWACRGFFFYGCFSELNISLSAENDGFVPKFAKETDEMKIDKHEKEVLWRRGEEFLRIIPSGIMPKSNGSELQNYGRRGTIRPQTESGSGSRSVIFLLQNLNPQAWRVIQPFFFMSEQNGRFKREPVHIPFKLLLKCVIHINAA
jgi:hypothetical protein